MKYLNRLKSARAVDHHRLRVVFADGFVGELDLAQLIARPPGPLEEQLRDPDFFGRVKVEDGEATWPNGYDVCADVLRYWCELGRVSSPEELEAHFSSSAVLKENT